jgi:hypothetical protein
MCILKFEFLPLLAHLETYDRRKRNYVVRNKVLAKS